MDKNIAKHCLKAQSELWPEICEDCPIYGETGEDHCSDDAREVAIQAIEEVILEFAKDIQKAVQKRIVEQLEDKVKEYDKRIERRNGNCYFDETDKIKALEERARGIERAIEIVKAGGADA